MNAKPNQVFEHGTLAVVLEGGPADLPTSERHRHIPDTTTKVKVAHQGGYEHFEMDGDTPGSRYDGPIVFRWTMRTKVAE